SLAGTARDSLRRLTSSVRASWAWSGIPAGCAGPVQVRFDQAVAIGQRGALGTPHGSDMHHGRWGWRATRGGGARVGSHANAPVPRAGHFDQRRKCRPWVAREVRDDQRGTRAFVGVLAVVP